MNPYVKLFHATDFILLGLLEYSPGQWIFPYALYTDEELGHYLGVKGMTVWVIPPGVCKFIKVSNGTLDICQELPYGVPYVDAKFTEASGHVHCETNRPHCHSHDDIKEENVGSIQKAATILHHSNILCECNGVWKSCPWGTVPDCVNNCVNI